VADPGVDIAEESPVRLEPLGTRKLKGFADPVPLFRVRR
jgi:class 3 adenylate cyclase